MAERTLLHKNKLQDFTQWLIADGWTTEPVKGGSFTYEILRARKPDHKHPLVVYDRNNAKEHYSTADRDAGIIQVYLKTKKQKNSCACTLPPLREVYAKIGIECVDKVPAEFYEFKDFWERHTDDKGFVLLYLDNKNKIVQ